MCRKPVGEGAKRVTTCVMGGVGLPGLAWERSGSRPGAPLYHKAMWEAKGRGAQILPSRAKRNQAHPNKIAWICLVLFVRIGTFQWVTAEKIKKFSLLL